MDPKDKKLLRENRVKFVKELMCTDVMLAHLQAKNIFTDEMAEEVLAEKTRQRQASTVLDILVRRGPKAFHVFCEALMESGQDELCEVLDPNFATKWREVNGANQSSAVFHPSDARKGPVAPSARPFNQNPATHFTKTSHGLPQFGDTVVDDPLANDSAFMNINVQKCSLTDEYVCSLLYSQDVYPLHRQNRGRAVVICNKFFMDRQLTEREGAEFDLVNLDTLFRELGFTTVQYEDKTAHEMSEIIAAESRHPEHKDGDAFILFLMTHGARGAVYGIDGRSIRIEEEIAAAFDAQHCPGLKGKPKILFVQACQGEALSQGIPRSDAGAEGGEIEIVAKLKELSIQDNPDSIPSFQSNVHEKADFIMAYSTVPGYKSWRRADLGSWFVRAICHVFSTYAHREHLTEMLTRVRNMVAEQKTIATGNAHYRQITETRETLLKKLYFFPGLEVDMRKDICDKK